MSRVRSIRADRAAAPTRCLRARGIRGARRGPGWHSATDSAHFFVVDGKLRFENNLGVMIDGPWSPTQQAWLRMRDLGNELEAATSPDGTTWTAFGTVAAFDLSSAFLDLGADAVQPLGQMDVGIFDDLVVCLP